MATVSGGEAGALGSSPDTYRVRLQKLDGERDCRIAGRAPAQHPQQHSHRTGRPRALSPSHFFQRLQDAPTAEGLVKNHQL